MEEYNFKIKEAPAYLKNESLGEFVGGDELNPTGCLIFWAFIFLLLAYFFGFQVSADYLSDEMNFFVFKSIAVIFLIISFCIICFFKIGKKAKVNYFYYENGIIICNLEEVKKNILYKETPFRFVYKETIYKDAYGIETRRDLELNIYAFQGEEVDVMSFADKRLFSYILGQYRKHRIPQMLDIYRKKHKIICKENNMKNSIELGSNYLRRNEVCIEVPVHYYYDNGTLTMYNIKNGCEGGNFIKQEKGEITVNIQNLYDGEGFIYILKNEINSVDLKWVFSEINEKLKNPPQD